MTRPPIRGDRNWDDADGELLDDEHLDDEYDDYDDDGYHYDRDYEDIRPPASRGRRLLVVLGVVLVFLLVAAFGVRAYVMGKLDPPGEPGEAVAFEIPTGSTNADIARILEEQGVVTSASIFNQYLRFKGEADFLAGAYVMPADSAAWDVVELLRAGPDSPDFTTFTVPEGLMLSEIPDAIAADIPAFSADRLRELVTTPGAIRVNVLAGNTNLEGFLFPDTYQVEAGQDEQFALQRMATQFDTVATELRLAERADDVGLTPYEVVIVASLIQEEYGITEEMGRISRVIHNRLEQGIPLGIDATSRYEAILAGRDRDDLDFESESPYNTRRIAGLPPTPIAVPGRAALEAALQPEDGPWTFYVRVPEGYEGVAAGGHFFTDSNSEFLDAKAECEAADLGCG